MKTTPYVYIVKNKTTNLKYIGVKFSDKDSYPNLFWKNYFTSSKLVKNLISIYGEEDFAFKIIKKFDNKFEALHLESKLVHLAKYREDYLNLGSIFYKNLKNENDANMIIENCKKQGKVSGLKSYKNKTGIFGLSKEKRIEVARKGGFKANEINRKLGRAIFDPKVRERQHKTLREKQVSAFYDPELKKEISSDGGKNSIFTKKYYEENGLNEEDRIKAQSRRGKIGGKKNKGFRFYTDGINTFKYTSKQQSEKSFEEFLKENKNYKPGRNKDLKISAGAKAYNDGIRMFFYSKYDQEKKSFEEFLKENPKFKKGKIVKEKK